MCEKASLTHMNQERTNQIDSISANSVDNMSKNLLFSVRESLGSGLSNTFGKGMKVNKKLIRKDEIPFGDTFSLAYDLKSRRGRSKATKGKDGTNKLKEGHIPIEYIS
jgi:hypothetical protein